MAPTAWGNPVWCGGCFSSATWRQSGALHPNPLVDGSWGQGCWVGVERRPSAL
jgi:hypothetical protein